MACLSRRASVGSLPLFPPASSLAGARHRHGHHQWPETAATHRPDIDASDAAAAGRLGLTAKPPRLPLRTNRHSASCRLQLLRLRLSAAPPAKKSTTKW